MEPLAGLADLLGACAPDLASAGARALYDGPGAGWFASDAGREQLGHWASAVAAAARSAHYDAALEATHRLVTQADYAGATLLERHSFLDRYGDIVVRGLQDRGAPRAELVGVRRLFSRLRQVLLETADARRAP